MIPSMDRLKQLATENRGDLSIISRELMAARLLIEALNMSGDIRKFPPDVEKGMIHYRHVRSML
jgi:hypothetical protein